MKIVQAAKCINRRVNYNKNCRFGTLKVELYPKYRKYQLTLICFKDKRNKEPILFLTNGWIKSRKELKRLIKGYFRRWGVEESYRFEKQGFGIEKATVRRFSRIQTLTGLALFISPLVSISSRLNRHLRDPYFGNIPLTNLAMNPLQYSLIIFVSMHSVRYCGIAHIVCPLLKASHLSILLY